VFDQKAIELSVDPTGPSSRSLPKKQRGDLRLLVHRWLAYGRRSSWFRTKKENKLKPAGAWHVVLALTPEKKCANTEMKFIGCSQAIRGRCTSCC
jgi:hypothetical protein